MSTRDIEREDEFRRQMEGLREQEQTEEPQTVQCISCGATRERDQQCCGH